MMKSQGTGHLAGPSGKDILQSCGIARRRQGGKPPGANTPSTPKPKKIGHGSRSSFGQTARHGTASTLQEVLRESERRRVA